MPYIYLPKQEHRCLKPKENEASIFAGFGAIWECGDCGKQYRLEYDQRDGAYWKEIIPRRPATVNK